MTPPEIENIDRAAAAAALPARHSSAMALLGSLSDIADQPPLLTLCAATLITGLASSDARLARAGGTMLAAALVATGLKRAVKSRVDRTRPRAVADGAAYTMALGSSHASDDNSFPSGHTAGAVAVARAFVRFYPASARAAYLAAGAAALVQIPRGKHYPSDLAAGAVVGLLADGAVEVAAQAVRQWLLRQRTP